VDDDALMHVTATSVVPTHFVSLSLIALRASVAMDLLEIPTTSLSAVGLNLSFRTSADEMMIVLGNPFVVAMWMVFASASILVDNLHADRARRA